MSSMSPTSGSAGRVIRAALVLFPLGLILLGAGSFIFYFNKREQTTQRAIKYAAGLRKELNAADLKHYEEVFTGALAGPANERSRTLATYLESTLGPENMGYTVRTVLDKNNREAPALAMDVEVTGSSKPRDLVMVLLSFLPELTTADNTQVARPAAVFLNLAHSLTGLAKVRSIRFVAVQNVAAVRPYYEQGVDAQERISHVILLGPAATAGDAEVTAALHLEGRGVVLLRPAMGKGEELLLQATKLQKEVVELAGRL